MKLTPATHARITLAPGAPHLSMIYDPGLVTRVILEATTAAAPGIAWEAAG